MSPTMIVFMRHSKLCSFLLVTIWAGSLTACSTMLPETHTNTTSFKSFEEARAAVEALEPRKSDRKALESNGFAPAHHPNMTLLTHADVVHRYVPSGLLKREDLDPGILACLEARDACRGVEVIGARISKVRTGWFWPDFLNFHRRTETTGWRFTAMVLLVNDQIVYRSWSGQPKIDEVEISKRPMGPLQNIIP